MQSLAPSCAAVRTVPTSTHKLGAGTLAEYFGRIDSNWQDSAGMPSVYINVSDVAAVNCVPDVCRLATTLQNPNDIRLCVQALQTSIKQRVRQLGAVMLAKPQRQVLAVRYRAIIPTSRPVPTSPRLKRMQVMHCNSRHLDKLIHHADAGTQQNAVAPACMRTEDAARCDPAAWLTGSVVPRKQPAADPESRSLHPAGAGQRF